MPSESRSSRNVAVDPVVPAATAASRSSLLAVRWRSLRARRLPLARHGKASSPVESVLPVIRPRFSRPVDSAGAGGTGRAVGGRRVIERRLVVVDRQLRRIIEERRVFIAAAQGHVLVSRRARDRSPRGRKPFPTRCSRDRGWCPRTMFSPLSSVPRTMFSRSIAVPHTMFSQSPPHAVPQTMFSRVAVPRRCSRRQTPCPTRCSRPRNRPCPGRCFPSGPACPTRCSRNRWRATSPHTMFSPDRRPPCPRRCSAPRRWRSASYATLEAVVAPDDLPVPRRRCG